MACLGFLVWCFRDGVGGVFGVGVGDGRYALPYLRAF